MFGGSTSTPTYPEATPAPTIDEAAEAAAGDVELKRKKGRLASILTSDYGAAGTPTLGTTTLMGK